MARLHSSSRLLAGAFAVLTSVAVSAQAPAPTPALPAEASGAEVYKAACQTCHAADGRGTPQPLLGFALPLPDGHDLPDFTDCPTNTAESSQDWAIVASGGGRVRGLDRHMPSFGEALSPRQLTAVVAHLKSFCRDAAWPDGTLNPPRAFFTEKAFPENEFVWAGNLDTGPGRALGHDLVYEHRLGRRAQYEVRVPVAFQPDGNGSRARGLGDVELALRRVVYAGSRTGSIVAAGGALTLPTGSRSNGLGNGFAIVEPFAMWDQLIGGSGFLQMHGGIEIPTDSVKGDREAFLRTAVGFTLAGDRGRGRSWSPMVELLAAKPWHSETEWDIVPQMQVSLSRLQHVRASVGLRVPLNERTDRHPQVLTYVLWDWFDGGFFKFWH